RERGSVVEARPGLDHLGQAAGATARHAPLPARWAAELRLDGGPVGLIVHAPRRAVLRPERKARGAPRATHASDGQGRDPARAVLRPERKARGAPRASHASDGQRRDPGCRDALGTLGVAVAAYVGQTLLGLPHEPLELRFEFWIPVPF